MIKWKFREKRCPDIVMVGPETSQLLQIQIPWTSHNVLYLWHPILLGRCGAEVTVNVAYHPVRKCNQLPVNFFVFSGPGCPGLCLAIMAGRDGSSRQSCLLLSWEQQTAQRKVLGSMYQLSEPCKEVRLSSALKSGPEWLLCHCFLRCHTSIF